MSELKCPHCGQAFTVDDTELSSIIQQIRDKEFDKDLQIRISELENHLKEKHELEIEAKEKQLLFSVNKEHERKLEDLRNKLSLALEESRELKIKLDSSEDKKELAISETKRMSAEEANELRRKIDKERQEVEKLRLQLANSENEKKMAIMEEVARVENQKRELENRLLQEKDKNEILLKQKDEEIAFYKDFKSKMSTKMIGESLEKHCELQFEQLRATAFKNAIFEKDNDTRTGSKGDYIYREYDENGIEIVSIMFEMKNEMETTATKHKNEDFYKELDKDRREKHCEYAILVSLLEADNELFNSGIVDVSHKYEKMYVVRPQCFIPIITLIRNASMSALSYKQELEIIKNQNLDISNFEEKLDKFKNDFTNNYERAHKRFDKAIEEIDKTIKNLQKVKEELLGSDNQLRIANDKVNDISVKKLVRGNETMKKKFADLKTE